MTELREINLLEAEAILLAERGASKHEINSTITEIMTVTKKYLGEVNSYFDNLQISETLPSRLN